MVSLLLFAIMNCVISQQLGCRKFVMMLLLSPPLQPLSGESITPNSAIRGDDARADIHARGFWGQQQSAFFDIRVFHPNAPSYRNALRLLLCFENMNLKKERIWRSCPCCRVCFLYTFGFFYSWGSWQEGHHFLQSPS